MGIQTIAEWVEDEATLRRAAPIGIDYAQGYGIERPCLVGAAPLARRQPADTLPA